MACQCYANSWHHNEWITTKVGRYAKIRLCTFQFSCAGGPRLSCTIFIAGMYTNNYYRFVVAVPNVRTPTPLKTFLWYEKSHWPDKKKGPLDGGGFAIRESLTREINEMITLDKKKKLPGFFFSKSYFVEMLVMTHSGHQMCYLVCAVLQVLIQTNYKLFTSLNFRTKLQRMEKCSREED